MYIDELLEYILYCANTGAGAHPFRTQTDVCRKAAAQSLAVGHSAVAFIYGRFGVALWVSHRGPRQAFVQRLSGIIIVQGYSIHFCILG